MCQGKLDTARRGELFATPPIGYARVPTGEWAIDPDEQVQAVVRRIFNQFDREAAMHGLVRRLTARLGLARRERHGTAAGPSPTSTGRGVWPAGSVSAGTRSAGGHGGGG